MKDFACKLRIRAQVLHGTLFAADLWSAWRAFTILVPNFQAIPADDLHLEMEEIGRLPREPHWPTALPDKIDAIYLSKSLYTNPDGAPIWIKLPQIPGR